MIKLAMEVSLHFVQMLLVLALFLFVVTVTSLTIQAINDPAGFGSWLSEIKAGYSGMSCENVCE